ncbi:MAG: SDR family NAD(P)-dependent oxidoreductase [Woeseiaceae bacterium]
MNILSTIRPGSNVVVVGATGGIGLSLCSHLAAHDSVKTVFALSRARFELSGEKYQAIDFDLLDETSIVKAAEQVAAQAAPDLVIVATGFLHSDDVQPERSLRELEVDKLLTNFKINTIGPTMVAKHFLPIMRRDGRSVFAVLSARVGSIGDNRLGGWLSYRSSKAALNMSIATLAIEHRRRCPDGIVVSLHPGTVDTSLSQPFSSSVPAGKLFSVDLAARQLLQVIGGLDVDDSGGFFAWDGSPIPY